jgi:Zn-dependent M28 family amino/carboxypeptidase
MVLVRKLLNFRDPMLARKVAAHIQRVTTRSTVRLIAFTLEECGYVGSTYYARRVKREAENIAGMIALEMVGFTARQQKYPAIVNPKYYPNVGDFIGIVGFLVLGAPHVHQRHEPTAARPVHDHLDDRGGTYRNGIAD